MDLGKVCMNTDKRSLYTVVQFRSSSPVGKRVYTGSSMSCYIERNKLRIQHPTFVYEVQLQEKDNVEFGFGDGAYDY